MLIQTEIHDVTGDAVAIGHDVYVGLVVGEPRHVILDINTDILNTPIKKRIRCQRMINVIQCHHDISLVKKVGKNGLCRLHLALPRPNIAQHVKCYGRICARFFALIVSSKSRGNTQLAVVFQISKALAVLFDFFKHVIISFTFIVCPYAHWQNAKGFALLFSQ